MDDQFISTAQAIEMLGVKPQTLYAYASRGMVRRATVPGSRRSMYARADLQALLARKNGSVIADAPRQRVDRGGIPVFESVVTQRSPSGLCYRGHDVPQLALHPGCVENVAELLWSGVLPHEPVVWQHAALPDALEATTRALRRGDGHMPMLRVMAAASLALGESAADELRMGSTSQLARRLVACYAGCLGYLGPQRGFVPPRAEDSVAALALRALGAPASRPMLAAMNALLIWCADDALSPSACAARLVAATGAGVHACLVAAVAAQSGSGLGGACDRMELFLRQGPSAQHLRRLSEPGAGDATLPGFDNTNGALGDPRAAPLLEIARGVAAPRTLNAVDRLLHAAAAHSALRPRFELGLVAVVIAMGLPARAAASLWTVGHSVGWVAHLMEQRLAGTRPRVSAR